MDQSRYYLRVLVEEIHSAIMATIDKEGHPVTRAIDIMLCDKQGVYFLTAKGKDFYRQLIEQRYIALSAVKDGKAISLRGYVDNIGKEKLDEFSGRIHICRKYIPVIPERHLKYFV